MSFAIPHDVAICSCIALYHSYWTPVCVTFTTKTVCSAPQSFILTINIVRDADITNHKKHTTLCLSNLSFYPRLHLSIVYCTEEQLPV